MGNNGSTFPGPVGLSIEKSGSYEGAVRQYADILNREAAGGWKLHCIEPVNVTKSAGCLGSLLSIIGLGQGDTTVTFNMLVFVKED